MLSDGSNTYTYGYNRIAQASDDVTSYFLGDALGSVRQVIDSNSEIVLSREYGPFGDTLASLGSYETDFGYTPKKIGAGRRTCRWYGVDQPESEIL